MDIIQKGMVMETSRQIYEFLETTTKKSEWANYGFRFDLLDPTVPKENSIAYFKELCKSGDFSNGEPVDLSLLCTRVFKNYPLSKFPQVSGILGEIIDLRNSKSSVKSTKPSNDITPKPAN